LRRSSLASAAGIADQRPVFTGETEQGHGEQEGATGVPHVPDDRPVVWAATIWMIRTPS
jgi:hypothetical protein